MNIASDVETLILIELFPTIFVTTVYGFSNVVGMAVAIAAPELALVQNPWPMVVCTITNAISIVLISLFKTGANKVVFKKKTPKKVE